MHNGVLEICFVGLMVLLALIGFFCAHKLSHQHPLWVRLVVLMPSLTALATIVAIANGDYVAYWPDVFREISGLLIYALVASRFTSNPWLDIRRQKKAG